MAEEIKTDTGKTYQKQLDNIKEQYENDPHKTHNFRRYLMALQELRSEVEFACILDAINGQSYDAVCKTVVFLACDMESDKVESLEECVNERDKSYDEITDLLHVRNAIFDFIAVVSKDANEATSAFDSLFDLFSSNKESNDSKEDKENG